MARASFVSPDVLRQRFSAAMSRMYRDEVPAYGALVDLVSEINDGLLEQDPALRATLQAAEGLDRISEERHGAIRLGTAAELAMMRRVFALMGMHPVGYYDLSVAGIPVHSTAFRPVDRHSLAINPFRVFVSLLRLDLLDDAGLRRETEDILAGRRIFTAGAVALVEQAEHRGGLDASEADTFINEILETFRWHSQARVSQAMYEKLHATHRLIADVVSFKGPHINHLTPRTLDIDRAQDDMPKRGIHPKAVVEGPPARACPILLRQTSFKALDEQVSFTDEGEGWVAGRHTARFGEIEQRGVALTPSGRALYDELLAAVRATIAPKADGSNAAEYRRVLAEKFAAFPDDWETLRLRGLAYFNYSLTDAGKARANSGGGDGDIEHMISSGLVQAHPIVYEDFLPVSAAGIFQSNLGDNAAQRFSPTANQALFEQALGAPVADPFALYAEIEASSITSCKAALRPLARAG